MRIWNWIEGGMNAGDFIRGTCRAVLGFWIRIACRLTVVVINKVELATRETKMSPLFGSPAFNWWP